MWIAKTLTLLLNGSIANDWVIDSNSLNIVIIGVVGVYEGICNVGHVVPSIAFASHVDWIAFHLESVDEALVETDELQSEFDLVGNIWNSLRVADTDWLLHPEHVREVDPCVWILYRCLGASFPGEGTILGQKTAEGTAAWSAIEPNDYLIRRSICGREEPREQLLAWLSFSFFLDWEIFTKRKAREFHPENLR